MPNNDAAIAATVEAIRTGDVDHALAVLAADSELEVLEDVLPLLGKRNLPLEPGVHERRLVDGERLILLSDAVVTGPRSTARRWDWRACAKLR